MIFLVESSRITIPKSYNSRVKEVDSICMAFQIIIADIFRPIRDWKAAKYASHREATYKRLALSHTISDLIKQFILKDRENRSRESLMLRGLGLAPQISDNAPTFKSGFLQLCLRSIDKLVIVL